MSMARPTTLQAIEKLIRDEDCLLILMKAGYSREDRSRFRFRLDKDMLSLDKMEEILQKCGYTVAQEKRWTKPNI